MRIQILHCAVAIFEDERPSERPYGIVPRQGDEIRISPRSEDLEDTKLAELVSLFQAIDLGDTHDSPIMVRREYVQNLLGIDATKFKSLLSEARRQGLLRRLTIEMDYGAWLRKCIQKGCLVVMVCVEQGDYDRDELASLFCQEVLRLRRQLVSERHDIEKIVLMPNAHLTDGHALETDDQRAAAVVARLREALQKSGLSVLQGSFGFGKRVQLVIMGHPRAYTFHAL